MSTANFYTENADSIYAVKLKDEFEYEGCKQYLLEKIQEVFNKYAEDKTNNEEWFDSSGLDYHAKTVASLYFDKDYVRCNNGYVYIRYDIGFRSAYYEGYNFDFKRTIEIDGTEFDLEDISITLLQEHLDISYYYWHSHIPPSDKYTGWIVNYITKTCVDTEQKLNKIFADICEHNLSVFAHFSNGESVYVEANSVRAAVAPV